MIEGVHHQPYGFDSLYGTEPTERSPRDPSAGNVVSINVATWPVEDKQAAWITWTKNGTPQPDVQARFRLSRDDTSFWRADLGTFQRGDEIAYTVHANEDGADEQTSGPFTFSVTSWSHVTHIASVNDTGTCVDVHVGDSAHDFTPVVRLTFPVSDTLRVQFSPTGKGLTAKETVPYHLSDHATHVSLTTEDLVVKIDKNPYRLSIFERDGTTLLMQEYDPETLHNLGWASDGKALVSRLENHFATSPEERFHGFGERYDHLNQYGQEVSTFEHLQHKHSPQQRPERRREK